MHEMDVPLPARRGRPHIAHSIEERAQIAQQGGSDWLAAHLRHNGFDPFTVDGRDVIHSGGQREPLQLRTGIRRA